MGLFDRLFGKKDKEEKKAKEVAPEELNQESQLEASDQSLEEKPSEILESEPLEVTEEGVLHSCEPMSIEPLESQEMEDSSSVFDDMDASEIEANYQVIDSAAQEALDSLEKSQTTTQEALEKEGHYESEVEKSLSELELKEASVSLDAVDEQEDYTKNALDEPELLSEKESDDDKYNRSLKKTRTGFSARLNAFFANFRTVDEDFFEDLEEMLILSDVGVHVATTLTEELRYEA